MTSSELPFANTTYEGFKQRPLARRVEALLEQRGIKAPPVEFSVALTRHHTSLDARGIRHHVRDADIFIPEAPGYTYVDEQTYRRSSFGGWLNSYLVRDPFHAEILKTLRSTKTKIGYVDIPSKHPLVEAHEKFFVSLGRERAKLFGARDSTFQEAVEYMIKETRQYAELTRQREEYILEHLPQTIAQTIAEHPELQSPYRTAPIKVFMSLGSNHMGVASPLKVLGESVQIMEDTLARSPQDQVQMKAAAGEQVTEADGIECLLTVLCSLSYRYARVSDKRPLMGLEKAYGEGAVLSVLVHVCKNDAKYVYERFVRALGGRRSYKRADIEQLFADTFLPRITQIKALVETYLRPTGE